MKRLISVALLVAVLACALALVGNFGSNTARGATQVTGIISSDSTWTQAGSPYNLIGNVLINNGVTLTIQPGVSVNLNSYYIMVNGTLDARGTSTEKVLVNGGEITFTQFSTDWNETTGIGCIIDNAIISINSLSSANSLKISNSTINTPISVDKFSTVANNAITQQVTAGGYSELSNNDIKAEVNLSGSSSASNNTISGAVRAEGSCIVSNNTITGTGYDGIGLICVGSVSVSYNVVSGYSSGIKTDSQFFLSGGFPMVENNLVFNNTIGIESYVFRRNWVGTNIPTIQNNVIFNNTKGITLSVNLQELYGDNPPTTIQNNTISQNIVGLELSGSVDYCTIQYNNIQEYTDYNLYLGSATDFNATYNWWGTIDTQVINQSIYDFKNDFNLGKVSFIPFLMEANSAAPEIPIEPTPTPTPTPSPTPSPAPSPTPTPTSTPSPTPSPSASASPSPTDSPSPSPTPESTPSPSPTVTESPSPTPTPSPPLTPSPSPFPSPSSTPQPTPTVQPDTGILLPMPIIYAIIVTFVALAIIIVVLLINRRK